MIHFKDNKNKSPLNTRWAQMTKQEQIIERKKIEIQAKLESQKQAAALAVQAKLANPNGNDDNSANIFSNDGSFMNHFKALLEKQKEENAVKLQNEQKKPEDEGKKKEAQSQEPEDSFDGDLYGEEKRKPNDRGGQRDNRRYWNDRRHNFQNSPMAPVVEEPFRIMSMDPNNTSIMQIPGHPHEDGSDSDHNEWSNDQNDSNPLPESESDQNQQFRSMGPRLLPPGPLPPGTNIPQCPLPPGGWDMMGHGPNMGPRPGMCPGGPMMGPGGPNMPPMPPGGPNMPLMPPGGPNMPPMPPGGPNMPPMPPGGPNMPPMPPGGPMPPFMGGPPNYPMPPNWMPNGPRGPCGPMPPNMMGPNGPMPPFFPPFNPSMMGMNGPPGPPPPPPGPPTSMAQSGPPNSMMGPNGSPMMGMPPNSMSGPNGPSGVPGSMMGQNGPPNLRSGPNGPPGSMMGPSGSNSMMPPGTMPMGPMGTMPFMGPPRPPFPNNNFNNPKMPFIPHTSMACTVPEPKPVETIPPPEPMKLQNIPPPMPLPLNHIIPKPKDLEIDDIKAPSQLSQVFSPDMFPPTVVQAASEVAVNGDRWENVLKAIHTQDQNMWFLHNQNGPEYKAFRQLVEQMRVERENQTVKDEDKYEPEFCLDDDDSNDAKPHFKDELNSENSSNYFWQQYTVKREGGNSSQSEDEADSKRERRKRKKKSRWGDEPPMDLKPPGVHAPLLPPGTMMPTLLGAKLAKIDEDGLKLTNMNRSNQALMQYAMTNYGSTNLDPDDWKKCEDNFKLNLLYQDMLKKRNEVERLAAAGKNKYEYDSDEDTSAGTWEHKLRSREMNATEKWADELTKQAAGKHHIGDFLPPEELRKFMEKYSAVKSGKEPDLSDYKEFKLKEDNVGFKMLQKFGWSEGQGLGADGSGIVEPINKASQPVANLGLGAQTSDIVSSEDDEFDAYRKRMMLAYRFRPNPLNNPRRPYY